MEVLGGSVAAGRTKKGTAGTHELSCKMMTFTCYTAPCEDEATLLMVQSVGAVTFLYYCDCINYRNISHRRYKCWNLKLDLQLQVKVLQCSIRAYKLWLIYTLIWHVRWFVYTQWEAIIGSWAGTVKNTWQVTGWTICQSNPQCCSLLFFQWRNTLQLWYNWCYCSIYTNRHCWFEWTITSSCCVTQTSPVTASHFSQDAWQDGVSGDLVILQFSRNHVISCDKRWLQRHHLWRWQNLWLVSLGCSNKFLMLV